MEVERKLLAVAFHDGLAALTQQGFILGVYGHKRRHLGKKSVNGLGVVNEHIAGR